MQLLQGCGFGSDKETQTERERGEREREREKSTGVLTNKKHLWLKCRCMSHTLSWSCTCYLCLITCMWAGIHVWTYLCACAILFVCHIFLRGALLPINEKGVFWNRKAKFTFSRARLRAPLNVMDLEVGSKQEPERDNLCWVMFY